MDRVLLSGVWGYSALKRPLWLNVKRECSTLIRRSQIHSAYFLEATWAKETWTLNFLDSVLLLWFWNNMRVSRSHMYAFITVRTDRQTDRWMIGWTDIICRLFFVFWNVKAAPSNVFPEPLWIIVTSQVLQTGGRHRWEHMNMHTHMHTLQWVKMNECLEEPDARWDPFVSLHVCPCLWT